MKPLQSLSISTDLIFARSNGQVLERDDYLVIRTPSNQGYHWGNYLAFTSPPTAEDAIRWPEIFRKEFSDLPDVRHMAMTWDQPRRGDAIDAFTREGFTFESNVVLATQSIHPPQKLNRDVEVLTLETDAQWESAIQDQMSDNEKYDAHSFEVFKRAQMANYRKISEAGMGKWFGAYLDGHLVADLGVFFKDRLARFQSVVTHPLHRRKGICGRLVFETATYAIKNFKAETLVMVADENYHAAKIYESVGFKPVQSNYTLAWWQS